MNEIIRQKTTWAGLALIASMALPQFGIPANICQGIQQVIMGLAIIFLRQSIAKTPPPAPVA